jgi:hypothetical protein
MTAETNPEAPLLGPNSAELDGVSPDRDKDVEDLLEALRHAGQDAASLHERLFRGLELKYVQAYRIGTYDLWVISPTLEYVKKTPPIAMIGGVIL